MRMCVYKYMQRPEELYGGNSLGWVSSSIILYLVPLSQGHPLNLKLPILARMAGQQVPRIYLSPNPNTIPCRHVWFLGVLEISLKFLCLHSKRFYELSHLPRISSFEKIYKNILFFSSYISIVTGYLWERT